MTDLRDDVAEALGAASECDHVDDGTCLTCLADVALGVIGPRLGAVEVALDSLGEAVTRIELARRLLSPDNEEKDA